MAMSAGQLRYMRKQQRPSGVLEARQRNEMRSSGPDTMIYKDLGMELTEDQYSEIQQGMSDIKTRRQTAKDKLTAAQNELNALVAKHKQDVDTLWSDYGKGFVEVKVYSPGQEGEASLDNVNLEATYRLPKELVDKMEAKVFSTASGSWEDGVYHLKPGIQKGGGEDGTTSWHTQHPLYMEALTSAERDLKGAYYKKIAPQVIAANQALEKGRAQAQGTIDSSRATLTSAETADKELLDRYRTKYAEQEASARETAQALFRKG